MPKRQPKLYAIQGPDGFIFGSSVSTNRRDAWTDFYYAEQAAVDSLPDCWPEDIDKVAKKYGYRCVEVEVTAVEKP